MVYRERRRQVALPWPKLKHRVRCKKLKVVNNRGIKDTYVFVSPEIKYFIGILQIFCIETLIPLRGNSWLDSSGRLLRTGELRSHGCGEGRFIIVWSLKMWRIPSSNRPSRLHSIWRIPRDNSRSSSNKTPRMPRIGPTEGAWGFSLFDYG